MKAVKRILIGLFAVLFVLGLSFVVLYFGEIRTLSSLKKLDNGMYQINYRGNYYFDDFVKKGAENMEDSTGYLIHRFTKGIPLEKVFGTAQMNTNDYACSAFVAKNDQGEVIMGRNFEFSDAPSIIVHTNPKNGFSSVGIGNLAFSGYSRESLPKKDGISKECIPTLFAPYICMDGMNEKGVAIAILACPLGQPSHKDGVPTLSTISIVRLVLDHASTVDEAMELMQRYNLTFEGGPICHFFIADASGKSVVVEYADEKFQIVEPKSNYQLCTNFNMYQDINVGYGYASFDDMKKAMEEHNGVLTNQEALDLVHQVSNKGQIQWSVLYNLTTGECEAFPRGKKDQLYKFQVKMR